MRTKRYAKLICFLLTSLLIASLLITGCGQAEKEKVVLFGAALPLTGSLATEGQKHQQGYDLWKDTVNAAGGINIGGEKYKVDIKYYDYKSDTATAVKLTEKLITEDGVKGIFGPLGSGAAKAVSAVTEKYQVPMVAPSASSVEVFTSGYKYIFGTFTPNATLTEPLATIASQQKDPPKTVAIIARNDLFPISIANEAKISAEKRGMQVVAFEQYAIGTTDFSPSLIQLKAKNADWIFATGYANDLILLTRQMKELDVNAKMVTMIAGAVYKEYIEGLNADANYVNTACWWFNNVEYQGKDIFGTAKNFTDIYNKKYGYVPDYANASCATVGIIFQNALERAGSTDPKKLRDAIASSDFMSFWGPIKFDERGMISALAPPVLQIQNGKLAVIHPDTIANSKLLYPMPKWKER